MVNANDSAREILGPGLVGRHFLTALRQPGIVATVEACLAGSGAQVTEYKSFSSGRDTRYEVTVRRIDLPGVSGALLVFRDLSAADQIGQMRRDFVANVSHELRTPLTAMMGFIETLRGPARDDAAAQDRFLSVMADEAARMNRLITDLLSLSRAESPPRGRPKDAVVLGDVIAASLRRLAPLAEENAVTIDVMPNLPKAVVSGDPDQLGQVFGNLVENAVKYGAAGGAVEIGLTIVDRDPVLRVPAVIVHVQDYGPGIAGEHLPRLTERFYRVDAHRSRNLGGTGLGLAIVKHIVNRHRGRLDIDSAPGRGSRFSVILPRRTVEDEVSR